MESQYDVLTSLPTDFPGMESLTASTVYLMGCRTFSQYCCTLRSLLDPQRFCPFCIMELTRRNRNPMAEVRNWMLVSNEFPHKNTKQMWLLVPKRHVASLSELVEMDWRDIGALFNFCQEQLRLKSGGVMFRFGDPRLNVGTVEHLHINVVEPICGKEYRPPFAKNMIEHAEDYQRMLRLQQDLSERGGMRWLLGQSGISETQPV